MTQTPLLFLHGALGNKEQFRTILPTIQQNYPAYALDFPGHGENVWNSEQFGIVDFGNAVVEFLDKNHIKAVHIFGYSMGGYVGLWLAYNFPERVEKVYTLGTKIWWTNEEAERETKMLDYARMKEKIPAFVNELEHRHPNVSPEELLRSTREMMLALGSNNLLHEDILKQIQHKIRISIGDRDNATSISEALRTYITLPNSEFEVLPATPHPFEKVNLSILALSLQEFFRR